MILSTTVSCSLFYVDDDPDDLELFKEACDGIGEDVCIFQYADLMLHSLHNPPPSPSIVFVDLNMPTLNGFDVISEIKSAPSLSHLPIIVYSTSSHHADIERCKLLGVSLFVTKPSGCRIYRKW